MTTGHDYVFRLATTPRSPRSRRLRLAAVLACSPMLWWATSIAYKNASSLSGVPPVTATVVVDRGDVTQVVTENGSIESSDDDLVRCRVEPFLSLPVAASARPDCVRSVTGKTTENPNCGDRPGGGLESRGCGCRKVQRERVVDVSQGRDEAARQGGRGERPDRVENEAPTGGPEGDASLGQAAGTGPEPSKGPKRPTIRSFEHIG